MNVLLVIAHPNPRSFNHALAEAIRGTTLAAGHHVDFLDLYAERFDPVLPEAELAKDALLSPEIEGHCSLVEQADRIAVVHPNWWSAPPAVLRGYVDRCLRPGRAYNFVPDGKGGAKPVGLLKARAALVINTANTPQTVEESVYGDPLQTHWLKVVFGLCGVTRVLRQNFSPILLSTRETREQMIHTTRQLTWELLRG